MPLYQYRCADCGHEIEVLRKVSDPAPVECPSCHQPSLQKKLTAAGFQLKGTGWYVTDFRGGNTRPDKPADAPASGEAAPAAPAAPGAGTGAPAASGTAAAPASAPAAPAASTPPASTP